MSVYIWTVELESAYIGDYFIPPKESIVYKMNADSNGRLYVPIAWIGNDGNRACPYNWDIRVDWWTATNYSWTWSSWWSITLSWYTAWSSHTIIITPVTPAYQRARAYWRENTVWKDNLTEIIYDWSYMWFWISATDTWYSFRRFQYYECTSLINAYEEVLPDTVTGIWQYFRSEQYRWCTSLTKAADEVLPSWVKTILSDFRRYQYLGCTSITTTWVEALPDTITSIWTRFRDMQYQWCTSLTTISWWIDLSLGWSTYRRQQFFNCHTWMTVTVLSDVWYSSYSSDTLNNSYVDTVRVPNAYLNNFKNSSNWPWTNITDSKFIWY